MKLKYANLFIFRFQHLYTQLLLYRQQRKVNYALKNISTYHFDSQSIGSRISLSNIVNAVPSLDSVRQNLTYLD